MKHFHPVLAEDSVSCGCEIKRAFKNALLLADVLVALTSQGSTGMSGCKVLLSHASSQLCSSSLFCWKSLPWKGEMEGQCPYSGTETLFQPLEMFMVLGSFSQADNLGWALLLHGCFITKVSPCHCSLCFSFRWARSGGVRLQLFHSLSSS